MSKKLTPKVRPQREVQPDHLVIDLIQIQGLADRQGLMYMVKTVWRDAAGSNIKPGPTIEVIGNPGVIARDPDAWDRWEQTILDEAVALGELDGVVEDGGS